MTNRPNNEKKDQRFMVGFWGVRGTVPCPGPHTVRYGGNTSCVEMRLGGQRLIFDAGTGLRALGQEIAKAGPTRCHILMSHTHLDHIAGLPFFMPAYMQDNRFELWNGHLAARKLKLKNVLNELMNEPFFPVPLDIMHSCIAFHDFEAGESLDLYQDVKITTTKLNHPGNATAYRIEYRNKVACYVTDTEHFPDHLDENILALIENADLMIYDATYTPESYPKFVGWGHSTWLEGIKLCRAANVKKLIAFHHDPSHDDAIMDEIAANMAKEMPGSEPAREGLWLEL